jgi:type IV secretion system protein VirB5
MRARFFLVGILAAGLSPWPAFAQGIPVFDGQNLIQSILQAERALEQIDQAAKQYEKQVEELRVAIEQRDALLGSRGFGGLLNGADERASRRALPATLEELLRLAQAGDAPTLVELRRLYDLRAAELDAASSVDIGRRGTSDRTSRVYERQRSTTLANLAVSEKAYNDAGRRVESYERFLTEIDRAPDLKASTDLQSRIQAENGLTLNELVRLEAMTMATQGAERSNELAGRTNLSRFSQFDEEKFRSLAESLEIRAADERAALDARR